MEFWQIYYDDKQLNQMLPFAKPFKNQTLTPFFENSVIVELVMKSRANKIAVCSWNLVNKMRTNIPPYRKLNEETLNSEYDVLSFTKNSPGHGMLQIANNWHPKFSETLAKILHCIGFELPKEVKYPIYQNAFMAKLDIYQSYVKEMLIPAMEVMGNEPEVKELCWTDSGYYKLRSYPELQARVKHFLGTDYCPMHTFLCERMFSIWLENKNLNVQYI